MFGLRDLTATDRYCSAWRCTICIAVNGVPVVCKIWVLDNHIVASAEPKPLVRQIGGSPRAIPKAVNQSNTGARVEEHTIVIVEELDVADLNV